MARKRVRLKEGDIFYFSDNEKRCGVGQIIVKEINEYILVFDKIIKEDDVHRVEIKDLTPIFGGWTSDARVNSGDWKIIGNSPYRHPYEFPLFKVQIDDEYWVRDAFRNKLHVASSHEIETLNLPFSWSPIAYEKAFWAWHGEKDWEDRYEKTLIGKRPVHA